ncbi:MULTISPECIES: GNAT family N-acetyltransferase [unclassified Arthrobacter]|uniref:GNAT family N-acetyltransferase n=1 Tax=unclassified Arthrobacter TaxID=235627 RepID=UPI001E35E5CA|nr:MULTISPECIES: GNAT family N-acetyltransferase [unclassified Arthrobacter]MCC9145716.1 GNAT family N-acetyltransferase [Arthrobacter sp. zg-Y919]MDK1276945.1 GNAT family N-acetyltransferase [Arthrobacter sp. zg.Y919]MDM7989584.1 GNAT family N-acetyltransferase [Arthrobacter sp. zg-Y877]WIB04124.1 GNAT family N-acetyltransferase [Arthrobacter sp. zg-Y919]
MAFDIPLLTDDVLQLRPHTLADLDAVHARCVDPLTVKWTTVPLDYTRPMAQEYLETISVPQENAVSWAIDVAGSYAGTIDLRFQGAASGSLGFVTSPEYRGRGLMSRAVRLVVGHAFEDLDWDVVTWSANTGNTGSYKTVWRCGFPQPITVPYLLNHRGKMVEGWISSLGRDDPREPAGSWEEAAAVLTARPPSAA